MKEKKNMGDQGAKADKANTAAGALGVWAVSIGLGIVAGIGWGILAFGLLLLGGWVLAYLEPRAGRFLDRL